MFFKLGFAAAAMLLPVGVNCCGIIGVISTQSNAEKVVMEGIQLLQNRGYDSAGIATLNHQGMLVTKYASDQSADCFAKLHKEIDKHIQSFCGIGHTRWATCGSKVDKNAHPQLDQSGRVAVVHNGTLENYVELKEELISKGVQFSSETDTEVIAQLIAQEIGKGFLEAVEACIQRLEGQWGLVVMDRENPEKLIVCCSGSPLLVGYNEHSIFVASEKIAFEKYTPNYISLKDGEIMELDLKARNTLQGSFKHRVIVNHDMHIHDHTKPRHPYTSFFEQEIFEQPSALLRALGNGGRLAAKQDSSKLGGLERKEEEICSIKNMTLLACGSSFNAALSVLPLMKRLKLFDSVNAIEASEFMSYDISHLSPGMIVVSQSGETKDIMRVLSEVRKEGVFTMGVVNVVGSMIATNVDCGVYMNCGREVAVAATKSFLSSITSLILIILWISHHKEKNQAIHCNYKQTRCRIINQLRTLPMIVGQALAEAHPPSKAAASILLKSEHVIILGKGPSQAIAREGALKLKEQTYKHAEAFSAGELKHGPLALIDHVPTILIILDDEYFKDMVLALSEVSARHAVTIVITNCAQNIKQSDISQIIEIPSFDQDLTWILATIPFQLIALELCKLLNLDADKPKNLAKTVTTG